MIKPYIGPYWPNGNREEEPVEAEVGDGFWYGTCDICSEGVGGGYGDCMVSADKDEIEIEASFWDWAVFGDRLICPDCQRKIVEMKNEIKVVVEGADNGSK